MHEALYYKKLEKLKVRCGLCPFNCLIENHDSGHCRVRINQDGVLYSKIYNRISGMGMDPIEKKPLFNFYPGSRILSIGTIGCNFRCSFCQNWEISQTGDMDAQEITPEYLLKTAQTKNSIGIAYTYSEPSIWIETVLETARVFKENNLKNVMITNGYINPAPLQDILPFIDAMNIDVKAFDNKFYQKNCSARLEPVKKNVEYLHDKTHIELTMLVIPDENDDMKDIEKFALWVASLDKNIPVHFSAYYPRYKMSRPATQEKTLEEACNLAKTHLNFVYAGNIHSTGFENTVCPSCNALLIERDTYNIKIRD